MAEGLPPAHVMGLQPLGYIIEHCVKHSFASLQDMSRVISSASEPYRKEKIRDYVQKAYRLYLRLLILVKWCKNQKTIVDCWEVVRRLGEQESTYKMCADGLFFYHETLWEKRAPLYAIPTAVDVLTTGTYNRLPTVVSLEPTQAIGTVERMETFLQLNDVVRMRLMYSRLPKGITSIRIAGGRVHIEVNQEFECTLTLQGWEYDRPWRMLTLNFMITAVKDATGTEPALGVAGLTGPQTLEVQRQCQLRLDGRPEHPLVYLYDYLHYFCMSVQLAHLHVQAQQLLRERWAATVRIHYIPGSSLTIFYWLGRSAAADSSKEDGQTEPSDRTKKHVYVRLLIEEDKERAGAHLPLVLQHNPPLDSSMPKHHPLLTADLMWGDAGLSVELLLGRVVLHHTSHRMAHMARDIRGQAPALFDHPHSQVLLINGEEKSTEAAYLQISHVEGLWLALKIDPRSGRLLLTDEQNPIAHPHFMATINREINESASRLGAAIGQVRQHVLRRCVEQAAEASRAPTCTRLPTTTPVALPANSVNDGPPPSPATPAAAAEPTGLESIEPVHVFVAFPQFPGCHVAVTIPAIGKMEYHAVETRQVPGSVLLEVTNISPLTPASATGHTYRPATPSTPQSLHSPHMLLADDHRRTETDLGSEPPTKRPRLGPGAGEDARLALLAQVGRTLRSCRLQLAMDAVRRGLEDAGVTCMPHAHTLRDMEEERGPQSGMVIEPLEFPSDPRKGNGPAPRHPAPTPTELKGLVGAVLVRCFDPTDATWAWQVEVGLKEHTVCGLRGREGSGIVYDAESNVLVMRYRTPTQKDVAAFLADWHRFTMAVRVMLQYASYLRTAPQTAPLRSFLQLGTSNWTTLRMAYGPSGSPYFVDIQWVGEKKRYRTVYGGGADGDRNPHYLLASYLEAELNVAGTDTVRFAQALYRSHLPLCAVAHALRDVPIVPFNPPDQNGPSFIYSAMATALPRSASCVRMVIAKENAIDIKFAADDRVVIEDVALQPYDSHGEEAEGEPARPKEPPAYKPIPALGEFIRQHGPPDTLGVPFEHEEEPKPEVGGGGVVPREYISTLVPAIKKYAGVGLKAKTTLLFLGRKASGQLMVQWEEGCMWLHVLASEVGMRMYVLRDGNVSLVVTHDPHHCIEPAHNYALSAFFACAVEDATTLGLPRSANCYLAVLRVLSMHIGLFLDWLEVMRLQKDGWCVHTVPTDGSAPTPAPLSLHVHFVVPPTLKGPGLVENARAINSGDDKPGLVKLLIRLTDRQTRQYVDLGLYVDDPNHTVRGWDSDFSAYGMREYPAYRKIKEFSDKANQLYTNGDVPRLLPLSYVVSQLMQLPISELDYPPPLPTLPGGFSSALSARGRGAGIRSGR